MTAFSAQVAQNQYLAQGADLVHAVMSVTSGSATAAAPALAGARQSLVEALIVDCSGSMDGEKIIQTRQAVSKAIELLHDDTWFCVIAGTADAKVIVPLTQATPESRQSAEKTVRRLNASGGTAMSTWLRTALAELGKKPGGIHHALLLTDGKDQSEHESALDAALAQCEGRFQCDARGVGTDWEPAQLRKISAKLLGTLDIIPSPDQIEADFRQVIEGAMGKSVGNVSLRLWTPVGAKIEFCRLVYPEQFDLTERGCRPQESAGPRLSNGRLGRGKTRLPHGDPRHAGQGRPADVRRPREPDRQRARAGDQGHRVDDPGRLDRRRSRSPH